MSIDSYFGLCKPDEKKEITVKPALTEIVFEPKAVYKGNWANKRPYTFDASLRALKERGYERHPRPAEVFDLICNGLEGRLQPEQKAIADNMLYCYSEWMSMAVLLEGNLLYCYLDPENLVWEKTKYKYVAQGGKLKHAGEEVYSIGSIGLMNKRVSIKDVNEINPALVEKLWSRRYALLPDEVRQSGRLWLPPENVLWPVSRFGYFNSRYVIYTNCFSNLASRGVQRNA